jgi:hypothetical protein
MTGFSLYPSSAWRLLVFIPLLAGGLGCGFISSSDDPPGDPDTYLRATLNGETWEASTIAADRTAGRLTLSGTMPNGSDRVPHYQQHLSISLPWNGPTTYSGVWTMRKGDVYGSLFSEEDRDAELTTYYAVDGTDVQSTVTITSYHSETDVVEGTFELFYTLERVTGPVAWRRLPDTLRVTSGSFRVPAPSLTDARFTFRVQGSILRSGSARRPVESA